MPLLRPQDKIKTKNSGGGGREGWIENDSTDKTWQINTLKQTLGVERLKQEVGWNRTPGLD